MKNIYCLIIFLLLINLSACGKKQDTGKKEIRGKITLALGKVTVNNKSVNSGAIIKFGDVIETGIDGVCELSIGDKSLLRISTNSRLVFNVSGEKNILELQKGWLAGITRKAFTKNGIYLIKTPTVAAAIRGTSYCIKIENPKSSYFCVCNGVINLQGAGAARGVDVTSSHHSAKRFKLDKTGKLEIDHKPGLLYHGDKTIEELAGKINEKVDSTKAYKRI